MAIIGKDVVTLSQFLQCIILHIHQYRVHILYKPDPKLFIADWLSHHNHNEKKDRDMRPKHKCWHYQHNRRLASVHINKIDTRSNSQRCTPTIPQGKHHTWLATHKRWYDTRHTEILAHQIWVGHDRWCGCKRWRIIIPSQLQMQILSHQQRNHMQLRRQSCLHVNPYIG